MVEVVALMNAFIANDYEARLAVYAEPSRAAFEDKVRAVEAFFAPDAGAIGFGRAWDFGDASDDPIRATARSQALADIRPRILFMIRQYRHAAFGDLYRCYVDSGVAANRTKYFESYFVARTAKGLGIIARWRICLTCRGIGQTDGQDCYACGGSGWEPAGGNSLGELGPVIEVRRLQAPTDSISLVDYERD